MSQILIQGLLLSGLYALISIGFTMIFSVGRVLNLAYGAYLMLGGYSYFWVVQSLGFPKIAGILVAVAVGILAGLLKHRLIVKPLKSDPVAVEISTLILAVVIQAGIVLVFNDSPKIMHPIVNGVWRVGGATVTYNILAATIASWVILIGLYHFVRRTHVGRAISAVSMDVKGAALSGINPDRINMITWGLSGALGAVAGVFFASYTQLSPSMWVAPLIIAVAVVIVGGIGSIIGTLIVAHIIGFMEIISTTLIAAELRGVFTMLLIITVLVLMPKGLFGRGEL
ncbi:branched-chain amino acid ABC transporter permease [Ruegeria pomeroyi]|uniref:Branched-chain amino acid ABC transporter permease n=1 Tax=Ruegeria pomeroyi TaxID=89184 RepID=A0A9Q3WLY1_9RHOB|nr:branched-chain amino acid ABC transporter permease [Ruegeria pomeroyi]MCE8516844.1 branched-chain amino acid ABC transporter permease [Ruegeria pomeroyi]MCE8538225.1 branched-chain amino acid ABC transporter permease [Ruegeria pomeroyi]